MHLLGQNGPFRIPCEAIQVRIEPSVDEDNRLKLVDNNSVNEDTGSPSILQRAADFEFRGSAPHTAMKTYFIVVSVTHLATSSQRDWKFELNVLPGK